MRSGPPPFYYRDSYYFIRTEKKFGWRKVMLETNFLLESSLTIELNNLHIIGDIREK